MSGYPVHFEADYAERRSRLSVFFRLILAIPLMLVIYVYGILATVAVVIAWFAIVFTARYPPGLFEFVAGYTRALTRITGYVALMCDGYPPFWGTPDDSYPVRLHFDGPLAVYSRPKTIFRLILGIPLAIMRWAFSIVLELVAIAAWFVIVITGRQSRSMFELLAFCNSYIARADAYLFLLTETYPPLDATKEGDGSGPQPTPPSLDAPPAQPVRAPVEPGESTET